MLKKRNSAEAELSLPNESGTRKRVGRWSREEDELLMKCVKNNQILKKNGNLDFKAISANIPGRTAKQCRERYDNSLRPDMKRGGWTEQELILLATLMENCGQNWSTIHKSFKYRTYNAVKKRGRKLLGETCGRVTNQPAQMKLKKYTWTKDEEEELLKLHSEGLASSVIKLLIQTKGRSEADIERKLLETCTCHTCRQNYEMLTCNEGVEFKLSWSKFKAQQIKEKLLSGAYSPDSPKASNTRTVRQNTNRQFQPRDFCDAIQNNVLQIEEFQASNTSLLSSLKIEEPEDPFNAATEVLIDSSFLFDYLRDDSLDIAIY